MLPFKIQLQVRERIYLGFPSYVGQKYSCHGDGTQVLQWFSIVMLSRNMEKEIFVRQIPPHIEDYLIPTATLLWLKTLLGQNFRVTDPCHATEELSQWSIHRAL